MNENQFERVTGYEDADLPERKQNMQQDMTLNLMRLASYYHIKQNSFILASNAD